MVWECRGIEERRAKDEGLRDCGTAGLKIKGKSMRDYTKISAWQYSDDLTVMRYEMTQSFPKEELYGLTSQLRRAAYSVPSNIAEGSARNTLKDYLHFLYMARGSLTEVHYFTHLATRLTYINSQAKAQLREQISATFSRLHGLIQAVEKGSGTH